MIKKLTYILIFLAFASSGWAATYNYYFSDDAAGNAAGNDTTGDGSISTPWKSLSKARTEINNKNSGDTVNLYFDRGDTWSDDTKALNGTTLRILLVDTNDPIVNIDAYGTGNDPIFDGEVTDFSTVGESNCTSAPCFYTRFFEFQRENCSISNVEIKDVYGHAIYLRDDADSFTLSNSLIHDFGSSGIVPRGANGIENSTVQYNTFHSGQLLYENTKRTGWGAMIDLTASGSGSSSSCKNNTVKYNLVYDSGGEGINAPSSVIEYNVVGDTFSTAINTSAHDYDYLDAIVRHNFVIASSSLTYGWATCIRIYDEATGGDNSAADIEVYGNICINRQYGLRMYCSVECNNPYNSIKVHNNLFIDNREANILINNESTDFPVVYFYNNVSILYDRTGSNHTDPGGIAPEVGWEISNNAFWTTGGSPSYDSDFETNAIETDPELTGEPSIDWDGQSGSGYYNNIDFDTHLLPNMDSPLYQAGYNIGSYTAAQKTFLITGSDFEDVTDGSSAFETSEGSDPFDIGPWIIGASPEEIIYQIQGGVPSGGKIN